MHKYDFRKIEKKWQKKWLEEKIYEPDLENAKRPFYNLMMFPYPSAGGLHVGNVYAFTGSDIYGRVKRMQGYDVFEPIGLDGFGIHSENYALKIEAHPMEQAKVSEKRFYKQLQAIGNGFAWDERLETYDPEYYRWTQWIFVQLFKKGLAYRKKQRVNWCPKDKTVLADEQVISGKCERCGSQVIRIKREQWFFKITEHKYVEKLLNNLEKLDWSEKVKIAQRNWVGKSEGVEIEFEVVSSVSKTGYKLKVFTTRPDTLFGATFMVLSPDHEIFDIGEHERVISELGLPIKNVRDTINDFKDKKEVNNFWQFVAKLRTRVEQVDLEENREKEGKRIPGIFAINPATKEPIPIWVSDYVKGEYGTGAIMAVPAHDERDFAFAKKYNLPITQVIAPYFLDIEGKDAVRKDTQTVKRKTVCIFLKHHREDKYLCLDWEKFGWHSGIIGGVEGGEDLITAALREIQEETGYKNVRFVRYVGGEMHNHYYAAHKSENRYAIGYGLLCEITNGEKKGVEPEHTKNHKPVWVEGRKMSEWLNLPVFKYMWHALTTGQECFTGDGVVINSEKFDGVPSEKAKWEISKFVGGKKETHYRLRDWLISRQRYWGPPIPMIHCELCAKAGKGERSEMPGWYAVPEKDLPVKLPYVKDFRPQGKGESPLASVKEFYETECPGCGGKARRETDVSDTFLDSAWYYLRYLDSKNDKEIFDKSKIKKWLPAEMYIGGAEHAVLHLLYVRFLAMVFHDLELVQFDEPFRRFRAHGLLISRGAKMSKSRGNVVNPDEYIEKFGADALRMYLMFLAPFEQGGDFRDAGVFGVERFLNRVWKFYSDGSNYNYGKGGKSEWLVHRTIKKVTEDVETLHYNTAISSLMILLNDLERNEVSREEKEVFVKLLAPFAPHIAEEIWWEILGNKTSIHKGKWPEWDEKLIKEDKFTLVIQVNGRVRDTVEVPVERTEEEVREVALNRDRIKALMGSQKPRRIIYVPKRLINIVV